MTIFGSSGSGKTTFVKRLIEQAPHITNTPPKRIIYFYGVFQPLFKTMPNVEFVEGLPPSFNRYLDGITPTWLIIDDLMEKAGSSEEVANLFVRGSHHLNASVINLTQNLYSKGSKTRTLNLNSHYLLYFKNPKDKSMIDHVARQMFPSQVKAVRAIYEEATKKPYSYLFFDSKQQTKEEHRILSNILGEEGDFIYAWLPNA